METSEKDLIGRLRKSFRLPSAALELRDDAAILEQLGRIVLTQDLLLENVDFTDRIPAYHIGAKSLAVNLSDLAAMGAIPSGFLLGLVIPESWLGQYDELLRGLASNSERYHCPLLGGDLSGGDRLCISITAVGRLFDESKPLLRTAARPGQFLYVSRPLGGAAAGLELLRRGWSIDVSGNASPPAERGQVSYEQRELASAVMLHHVSPRPEVDLALKLSEEELAGGCIDISDGLSTDLTHLCNASGVGAVIEYERIPQFPGLERAISGDALDRAMLHGGEELALLFTSPLRESELCRRLGRSVYSIGRITAEKEILLSRDGTSAPLEPAGFDHFQ